MNQTAKQQPIESDPFDHPIFKFKKKPQRMRHQKFLIAGVLAFVLLVVSGLSYFWFVYSSTHITTDNAYIEADLFPLNSHIMGYVKNVLVQENDVVKKGQPLVELDSADVEIELEYKTARYQKALADVKRLRRLSQDRVVSQSDLENGEATVKSLKADRDGTLLKMNLTKVVAPVDGVVSKQGVHSGQFVQPGQSLMVIVSKEKVWVKANFKETQVGKVHKGMPVKATIDAYPHLVLKGRVESIYPSSGAAMSLIPPENATGNFTKIVQRIPVKISLQSVDNVELRPGMSVVATVLVE